MANAKAMNLAQFAKESKKDSVKKLVKALLVPHSMLNDIPLTTMAVLKASAQQLLPEGLPSFNGWGRINRDPNYFNAEWAEHEEATFLIRQMIQVDRALLRMKSQLIQDPFKARFDAWRDLLTYQLNYCLIYNDPAAPGGNKDAIVGTKARFTNPKYKTPAMNRIDCSDIDLSGTITAAIANKLLERLGMAFAVMGAPGGQDVTCYTNYIMKEKMGTALRSLASGAGWRTDTDSYGREVEKFRGAIIRDLGFRQDSATPLIANTEDVNGVDIGNGDRTSLELIHWGEGWMRGWQTNELEPEYLGITGVYQNVLVDWGLGIIQENPRSVCELYGIKIK